MQNKLLMMLSIVIFFSPLVKAEVPRRQAILSWNQNLTPLPMLDLVFLDPEMKHTAFGRKSLEISLENWEKNVKSKSKEYSKKSKGELRKSINFLKHFNHLLVKNYYQNDIREVKGHKISELSIQVRKKLSFLLNNILALDLEPEEKSLLTFQKYLIDFQNPSIRLKAVRSMDQAADTLSANRKRLILFGSYLVDLYKQGAKSKAAIGGLNHISPYMTKEAYTLSQLYLARFKLGYHFDGRKTGKSQPSYHRHLKIISKLCNSFSDTQNSLILTSILNIWAKAKDFIGEWDKLPFNTTCYKGLVPYLATREQVALKNWQENKHHMAYQIYDQIAEKTTEESKQVLIQKRILMLAESIYEQNNDIIFYQGVYAKALKLVKQTQYRMQLRSDLFKVTKLYLESAYRKYSGIPNLESIVNNFLNHSGSRENSRTISILEAKILHKNHDYEKAWKAYYKLSKNSNKNRQRILDLEEAIKNYALHYKWSLEKPWTNLKEKPKHEYQRFEGLHHELLNIDSYKGTRSWHAAINLGMLYLINKKAKHAYEVWKPYWSQNPKIKFTNEVGGALLARLYELQSWNLISEYLAFIKEHRLKPIYLKKMIPVEKYEERATYEIGKQAFANMELFKAERSFKTLTNRFKGSLSYPDYLAYMIKTSRLLHKYKPLRSYLEKYIEIGEKHRDFQTNLLSLINLLRGIGKIKETFLYAIKYIDYYPNHSKSQQIISLIVGLCNSLPKKYCRENTKQKNFSPAMQKLSSYEILKEKIISQKYNAKTASKNLNSKKLREIETELTNLGENNPMVKDTINYVWFVQIKIISDSLAKKLRSRTIKNSEAVQQYENIRQTFMGICNRKRVSSCAQSFKELLTLTTELKSFLALSDNEQLLSTYSKLELKLRKRMSMYLSRNITEPKVAKKILWETMKEWNFDDDPYTGIGYIQLIEYANKPQLKG